MFLKVLCFKTAYEANHGTTLLIVHTIIETLWYVIHKPFIIISCINLLARLYTIIYSYSSEELTIHIPQNLSLCKYSE